MEDIEETPESITVSDSYSFKLYHGSKKKYLLKGTGNDNVQKRISRKPYGAHGAIHLVMVKGKYVHIDCKNKGCGNNWTMEKNGKNYTNFFSVEKEASGIDLIKCKKCGAEHESG